MKPASLVLQKLFESTIHHFSLPLEADLGDLDFTKVKADEQIDLDFTAFPYDPFNLDFTR